ncbi:unnamed protein product [Acanthosepion pharaonis]|uniref:Uncharacterized protein n=1 Tax=Acanthosepion pharaonis TaxID=158019 RepID=A0A812BA06_ACAPH|nr:unnamed protein product [Sepia pharaonis]
MRLFWQRWRLRMYCLPSSLTARHCSFFHLFLAAVAITHRNSASASLPHTASTVHPFTFLATVEYIVIVFTSASPPHTASFCSSFTFSGSSGDCASCAAVAEVRVSIHCLPPLTLQGTVHLFHLFFSSSGDLLPHTAGAVHRFHLLLTVELRIMWCSLPPSLTLQALFIYFTFSGSSGDYASSSGIASIVFLCLPPSHCRHIQLASTFFCSSGITHHVVFLTPYTARHCSSFFVSAVRISSISPHLPPLTLHFIQLLHLFLLGSGDYAS